MKKSWNIVWRLAFVAVAFLVVWTYSDHFLLGISSAAAVAFVLWWNSPWKFASVAVAVLVAAFFLWGWLPGDTLPEKRQSLYQETQTLYDKLEELQPPQNDWLEELQLPQTKLVKKVDSSEPSTKKPTSAEEMTQQLAELIDVHEAGHALSIGWAQALDWDTVSTYVKAPLLQPYGKQGWQEHPTETLPAQAKVRANFRKALKLGGMPDSLIPIAYRELGEKDWVFGWTYLEELDLSTLKPIRPIKTSGGRLAFTQVRQDVVTATTADWADSAIVSDDGHVYNFGPFYAASDVNRLRVRSGGAPFNALVPLEASDESWYTRVTFAGPNLTGEPLMLKLTSGQPLVVNITKVN